MTESRTVVAAGSGTFGTVLPRIPAASVLATPSAPAAKMGDETTAPVVLLRVDQSALVQGGKDVAWAT
jgi:hypothetical protein